MPENMAPMVCDTCSGFSRYEHDTETGDYVVLCLNCGRREIIRGWLPAKKSGRGRTVRRVSADGKKIMAGPSIMPDIDREWGMADEQMSLEDIEAMATCEGLVSGTSRLLTYFRKMMGDSNSSG